MRYGLMCVSVAVCLWMQGCSPSQNIKPAVAHGAKPGDHWVPFLHETSPSTMGAAIAHYDKAGKQVGNAIYPFGKGAPDAIARPAIAYRPKDDLFLVAVPERVTAVGGSYDRIAARFFDGGGTLKKAIFHLFDDKKSTLLTVSSSIDVSPLRVTYNSLLDEFLVTAQRTVNGKNGVWAQRVSYASGVIAAPHKLIDTGVHGFVSHAVSHAPIAGTKPSGGRYLLTYGPVGVQLLDSKGKFASVVPLDLGTPKGGHGHPDVAFGTVGGKSRFLLVYSDKNNCQPGSSPCLSWTGVWGTYIDPMKKSYPSSPGNTPFPISKIWTHVGTEYSQSRVAYSPVAKAFFVVWREVPGLDPKNDESRSHIRGNKVDYFVPDGIAGTSAVKKPYQNIVISPVTGSGCKPSSACISVEDPRFPDVTAIGGGSVAVHWHQYSTTGSGFLHLRGKVIKIP